MENRWLFPLSFTPLVLLTGVIGEDMPRYQLFGPAVDEVQALESGGEAGCVHASATVVRYLEGSASDVGGRNTLLRSGGTVAVKVDISPLAASDIKVVRKQPDGTAFIQRDRVAGARGGIAW